MRVCVIYLVLFLGKNYSEVCFTCHFVLSYEQAVTTSEYFCGLCPSCDCFYLSNIYFILEIILDKGKLTCYLFIYYFFYVFCLNCIFQMSWEPSCLLNQIVPHFVLSHVPFYCLQYGWPGCEADSS